MQIARTIIARVQSVFAWWMADIRKRKSFAGKAASAGIGIFIFCCACTIGLGVVRSTGQAVGLVATNTPSPIPSATPAPSTTPLPTLTPTEEPPIDTPTEGSTNTPRPSRTPEPTRTLIPTETLVPTFTPEPTIATDPEGVEPVNGNCVYPYFIKISSTGLAHSISSRSYKRTNPVHCYATMKDATDHGYTEAGD